MILSYYHACLITSYRESYYHFTTQVIKSKRNREKYFIKVLHKNPSFPNLKEGFSYSIQLIFHTFCSTSALFSFLFRFIFFSLLTVPTNPFGKTSNTIMYNTPRIIVHRSKIGYSVASSDK